MKPLPPAPGRIARPGKSACCPLTALVLPVLLLLVPAGAWAFIEGSDWQLLDFRDPATSASSQLARSILVPDSEIPPQPEPSPVPGAQYDPSTLWTRSAAVWSSDLKQTSAGLTRVRPQPWSADVWIQGEPFHVGMDHRPLTGLAGEITFSAEGFRDPSGKFSPRLYVRYSTTGRKWSNWIWLPSANQTSSTVTFPLKLTIADADRARFAALLQKWASAGHFSGANADKFYIWLQQNAPKVLEEEIPLIRFLQIRLEDWTSQEGGIREIRLRTSWMVSGLRQ